MQIKEVKISNIIAYEKNAKKHPKDQVQKIANSIKEFGFVQPIVLDNYHNIVIGHGRVLGAKLLGLETIPCIYADNLNEEQIKALRLADNKLNESEWDFELLNFELEDIVNIDMGEFGFDLIDPLEEENEIVEDEAPKVDNDNPPIAKLGDIWQLGKHRLMCGDSTDILQVEELMNGHLADMVLTDPPYNVDYKGGNGLKIKNDNMDNDSFRQFLRDAFQSANSVLKQGGVFYIWHADKEGYNFRGACFDVGWKVRQCLIWNKNSLVMGQQDYHCKHEPCLYGWKDGASHLWYSDRKQTTIIDYQKPSRNGEHPTMKPVGLFDYQIQNNTKGEDIVLDLFMGSGTTLIACEQNNRIAYGLELDPKYVDVIIKRWENLTNKKAELIKEVQ